MSMAHWFARPVAAYSIPSAPSYSYYVSYTWGNTVSFNGQSVLYAYQVGFQSRFGSNSNGVPPKLIADFRRQLQNSSGAWGVGGLGSGTYHSDAWVTNVANAFTAGVNDGHPYQNYWIGYGVSNDDESWSCSSSLWAAAGTAWRNTLGGVALPLDGWMFVANDFEAWHNSSTGWASCGTGAINWENAETVAYGNGLQLLVANFGSDAHTEWPGTWSIDQVWQVSWGLSEAIAFPEIYCRGQPPEWVAVYQHKPLYFAAVTDESAAITNCYGSSQNHTYSWQGAWNALNNALVNIGVTNHVEPVVTIFP
jgi:hypothetical protein